MKKISAKEVECLANEGKTLNIIDVREADEVLAGTIPGSLNIPLGLVQFRMHELDKSKEYLMLCRSGGRSGRAAQFLEDQGYNATNIKEGIIGWEGKVENFF